MRKHSEAETFRITGARQGLTEDVRGRQRRYVISMAVRSVAVVLTAVLWNIERPVAIATLVLGIGLPYIAVVIANAGRENAPSLPSTFIKPVRPMLTSGAPESVPERPAAKASETSGDGG
ncbi:hypothetical protein ADL22_13655 [Streptomyces sp. NRRL F-4489]|uniref:DUF3099 domain-containing protein n=1 Tax=Streptomyces sp. NRRL F-4489 TaxID=1609095 RepID=UPI00074AE98E|nr:DUF3099 domain-containing protein [Streptomyces sp. NRRL F-4489]KUL43117.1 hypothetical protein ADL22_13655 [Streptomyces sp. NRRL F-4489]